MEAEMRNMKVDAQETRLIARQAKDNTDEILSILKGAKFWTAVATRYSTQFDGGYVDRGFPYSDPTTMNFWGMNTVRTRALATNKAIVGAWKLGATLLDRMRNTIFVGNQHANFLIENKVAVVAEERIGLAVHRPDYFVNVTLP